jgi:hypothetical protein
MLQNIKNHFGLRRSCVGVDVHLPLLQLNAEVEDDIVIWVGGILANISINVPYHPLPQKAGSLVYVKTCYYSSTYSSFL